MVNEKGTYDGVIAHVGYGDLWRFGIHFRRRFGQSPIAFRELVKQTIEPDVG